MGITDAHTLGRRSGKRIGAIVAWGVSFAALLPGGVAWGGGGSFALLPVPAGWTQITPHAISADGSTVVGQALTPNGLEAFRWDAKAGMVGLGDVAGGPFNSDATAVSADGSVVVGMANKASFGRSYDTSFVWTKSGGLSEVPTPANWAGMFANAVTADGKVILGGGFYGAKWSGPGYGTFTLLPNAGGGSGGQGVVYATSGDGRYLAGADTGDSGPVRPAMWVDGTARLIGDLPGGSVYGQSSDVSDDGRVVIGMSTSANGPEAFRWTATGGMVGLGDLPGGAFSSDAMRCSADGSVILGVGTTEAGTTSFVWTEATGMRTAGEVFAASGIELGGMTLEGIDDIAADDRLVVGTVWTGGGRRAFIAMIPEPGEWVAAFAIGVGLGVRRSRGAGRVAT
jgi:probable HAF family extracellular repeat protein